MSDYDDDDDESQLCLSKYKDNVVSCTCFTPAVDNMLSKLCV